jgi:suppressor of ftsI
MNEISRFAVLPFLLVLAVTACTAGPEAASLAGGGNRGGHSIHGAGGGTPSVPVRMNTTGSASAIAMPEILLKDGDTFALTADVVQFSLSDTEFPAYGYNGSIPGPLLRVSRGARITVPFTNNLDEPTTVHWHGLRHDIHFDGVPGVSQPAVQPGETFVYELTFKDEGVFWYHPHLREDRQQDLGLYGMIIVEDPNRPKSYDRDEVLLINDLLITRGRVVEHGGLVANFALMGRFGNRVLVNGSDRLQMHARQGETVRYHILNAASARPYAIAFDGASMQLIGSDLGRYASPSSVESVIVAPAERYTVDVFFSDAGTVSVLHDPPAGQVQIATVDVAPAVAGTVSPPRSDAQPSDIVSTVDFASVAHALESDPKYHIELDIRMGMGAMGHGGHMMHGGGIPGSDGVAGGYDGIEWDDDMPMMNSMSTSAMVRWILRETTQNRENEAIDLRARVGEQVVIRIHNLAESVHPMHHPIHLHGQRFVVLRTDTAANEHLVWKDTVLVRAGSTVDILVDTSEPGDWMLHCHIPEHLESGMATFFRVSA